jgi:hypothetical protein
MLAMSAAAPSRSRPLSAALLLCCSAALFSSPALAQPADPAKDQLPITGLTLYRSGVGSFQRTGLVDGDADVQLRFATGQINDIIKSMVLLDLDGGQIQTVSYGSKEPLARQLASFGVDISDNPSAGALLDRLRGSPVRLNTPEGPVTGTIMNVENRPTIYAGSAQSQTARHDLPWINLVTPEGVRSVNLTTVTGFQLLDKVLADELNKALAALAGHRADNVKMVDLALSGEGARRIVVNYVHEMPVWKTSYRLVLPEPGAKPASQLTIQGWAIVENTTDEDWKDIDLSLVAGRPVSFQMDLYEPLYVFRPEIPVPTVPGVMPRLYEGAEGYADKAERDAALREQAEQLNYAKSAASPPPAPGEARRGRSGFQDLRLDDAGDSAGGYAFDADDMARYAAQSQAQAGEVGEVFEYRLETPVTIDRQRSAMIPILSAAIDGRRVSIYNRADSPQHPMRGVEITNNSGLQLMPGPVSVYDAAAYAGDSQVGHISTGDKRLLAYAVDLDTSATVQENTTYDLRKIRIVDGLIEQTTLQRNRISYAFTSKDKARPRTILVEQSKSSGWTLVEPKKPDQETEGLYRFELELPAGKTAALSVVQEWLQSQSLTLLDYDLNSLLGYAKSGKVSQAVVDAFRKAAAMQADIQASERRLAQLDQERQAIDADQARIRQNMGSIDRQSEYYTRLLKKLNDQETRLEEIKSTREEEQTTLNGLREALNQYLRTLNVE